MRPWEEVFPENVRKLAEKAGFGRRQPYGNKPALLIIDVTMAFLGSARKSVEKSVEEYRTSCGEAGWAALEHIKKLLETSRAHNITVVFTSIDISACRLSHSSGTKLKHTDAELSEQANQIADLIAPLPSELVIRKAKASAFFGTPLDISLKTLGVDSLLICGTSTSGCVRASVVDAFTLGYKTYLVEECTFDRFELSHLVNLFDMNAKYADVVTLDEAIKYVFELEQHKSVA